MNQYIQNKLIAQLEVGGLHLHVELQDEPPDDWTPKDAREWFTALSQALVKGAQGCAGYAETFRDPEPESGGTALAAAPSGQPPEIDLGNVCVQLFGDWRAKEQEIEFSPVGKKVVAFLNGRLVNGKPPRVTKPVADGIREQFHILHAFRVVLESELKKAITRLQEEAQGTIAEIDKPLAGTRAEVFARGQKVGRYHAFQAAAQWVQNAFNAAHYIVHKDEDKGAQRALAAPAKQLPESAEASP